MKVVLALQWLASPWEKIFEKVKVSLVDVVDCFVFIVSVLDKACVAKDLNIYEINFNF